MAGDGERDALLLAGVVEVTHERLERTDVRARAVDDHHRAEEALCAFGALEVGVEQAGSVACERGAHARVAGAVGEWDGAGSGDAELDVEWCLAEREEVELGDGLGLDTRPTEAWCQCGASGPGRGTIGDGRLAAEVGTEHPAIDRRREVERALDQVELQVLGDDAAALDRMTQSRGVVLSVNLPVEPAQRGRAAFGELLVPRPAAESNGRDRRQASENEAGEQDDE